MAALTLEHVSKFFDDGGNQVVAVDDLSVEIEDGEFLVLVGPSGCGKSTTLRMIAGLETISEGELKLDGTRINDRQPQDRDIAMVFQSYALYPHMTVRANMRFGLEESSDLSSAEIDSRVEATADKLGIEPLLGRKPAELSGGQQQRVALGRAIVRDPAIFLMDEPLSNLDAKLRSQMRLELQQLQEDLGVTTVYVTHDQTEAMTMGDRIAILDDGELQQVATPLEAYHQPANRFVAGFIGDPSMNFFECAVEGDRLVADRLDYSLTGQRREAVAGEDRVTLGVRPDDIELVETATDPHDFEAVVDVVEPMGNENHIYLRFADDESETQFVVSERSLRPATAGDHVVVHIPEEAIHLFGDSGAALHNRTLESAPEPRP
ncbi:MULTISPECIES: ABC transporter ATP-binding protein [unclassified Haladaptatus]|uniref:ABC transporter ATP-binding protein n=1 Tax=unclassified Haladaptatus TaxID=2622732 RepID=UPI0023E82432|nr:MULTISPECIES: ABC transporter ATP-binding protein [unclassified Haladaptatus]